MSEIRVDAIKTRAGAVPKASDLGLNVTGNVLQIVQSTVNTASTTTSTSFSDVGLSASITPSSTSNKVLVTVVLGKIGQSNTNGSQWKIFRDSTVVIQHSGSGIAHDNAAFHVANAVYGVSNPERFVDTVVLNVIDSPSSTSALTYKLQWRVDGGTAYFNRWGTNTDAGSTSSITLTEIGG